MIVVAAYSVTLTATLADIGLTDDADAYVGASIRYAQWCVRALSGDRAAFSRQQVDVAWRLNAEHPPLAKLVMGATWWLFHDRLGWMGQVTGARLGTVAFSTLLAWLVFSLCWDYVGRLAAFAAPLFLLTMPRFFFHSHVETLDVAVAAASFLTFVTFVRSLRSTAWGVACGFAFGLALLTKLNAPFFLIAFAIFPLFARSGRARAGSGGLRGVPTALASMVVVGPLMFVGLWPWLWFDTVQRLSGYVGFHLRHYGILFLYFGRIYEDPPAPWHAPFVMTAITTPPVVLALALAGMIMILRAALPGHNNLPPLPGDAVVTDNDLRHDLGRLLLLAAATAIAAAALPGVPKYGGVKLFLPLFPFLAVLAGWGVELCVGWLRRRLTGFPAAVRWAGPVAVAAAVLPGATGVARIHPYELSYYSMLVGGLPGAVRVGFERQYYDLIYVEMTDWFNRALPHGTRITFLPNNKEYVRNGRWWFRDGRLRQDLRFVGLDEADVLVLTHERRWPQYPVLFEKYRALPVLWQLEVEGVPLLTVYRLERRSSLAPQVEDEVRPGIPRARDFDPEAPLPRPLGDGELERPPSAFPGRLAFEHGPAIDENLHAHGCGRAPSPSRRRSP